ncbi:uncharacterized protein LOC143015020 [Genypterus blacodes]|uniref:uncharacterized protein LOC143015020 n=1 Tax=Genypterus blacodes TaxID=154954 RepID=UPI003F76BF28
MAGRELVRKTIQLEKRRQAGSTSTDPGGCPIRIYTAAEEALLKILPVQAAVGVSEVLDGVEVALEHKTQAAREQLDKPNTSAAPAVRGHPKKPDGATTAVEEWQVPVEVLNMAGDFGVALERPYAIVDEGHGTGEQCSVLSDDHASAGARNSRPPSNKDMLLQIVEAQREVRDLLQDLNQTIAKGFNDIAAAIRTVTEGNH